MIERKRFVPALVFAIGCVLLLSVQAQRSLALQAPLSQLPAPVDGYAMEEIVVPEEEARVAGMTSYVNRVYTRDSLSMVLLYVGYYDSQSQGKTVHSPKNCLPGGGWEAMTAEKRTLALASGPAEVNRYIIANKGQQAVVYYWYQGRGRVAANEYLVKWDLLRDAAIRRRTDEALVRLIIPVSPTVSLADADQIAEQAALRLIPSLKHFLPA